MIRSIGACVRLAAAIGVAALIAACGGRGVELDFPEDPADDNLPPRYTSEGPRERVFGSGGFDLLGTSSDRESSSGGGIGVNAYLWRAALDTIVFMPMVSADPFGGVIITDWYGPPETPSERFKVNVYILGRALRADGIRVTVFRQSRSEGAWRDAGVGRDTAVSLENQILARARQLRLASAAPN